MIAREVLDKDFGGVPKSTMNQSGHFIFHSEFIRNCQFNGWFSEPQSKNLSAYDYNKHYTSCLIGDGVKFGFPVYSCLDEVKPFNNKNNINTGFYYIETTNFFPFRGNGWYDADLIYYGLSVNIITNENIKYEYLSSNQLNPKHFEKYINYIYSKFENPKIAINGLIGFFGHDYKSKNTHHFTSDSRHAFHEIAFNEDINIKYIYHEDFNDSDDSTPIDIDNLDITEYMKEDKPLCYHLYNNKKILKFQHELPIFYKIYNV